MESYKNICICILFGCSLLYAPAQDSERQVALLRQAQALIQGYLQRLSPEEQFLQYYTVFGRVIGDLMEMQEAVPSILNEFVSDERFETYQAFLRGEMTSRRQQVADEEGYEADESSSSTDSSGPQTSR